jgi:hypothetical protein
LRLPVTLSSSKTHFKLSRTSRSWRPSARRVAASTPESKDPNTRCFHIHEDDPLGDELGSWITQASEPGDPLF